MTLRSLVVRALPLGLVGALVAVVLVARPAVVDDSVEPAIVNETPVRSIESAPAEGGEPAPKQDDHDEGADDEHDHAADGEVVARLDRTEVDPFSMVGVTWAGEQGDYTVEISYRRDGVWSDPEELHVEGDEPVEGGRPGTEPLWVGDAADGVSVSVRSASGGSPTDVKVATIDPNGTPNIVSTAGVAGQPPIISRSQWGASSGSSCDGSSYNGPSQGAVIHHTAGTNSYTQSQSAGIVKSTQAYHTGSRKWCDIGYNFLVDKYGQIFEGRKGGIDKQVRGAHAGNGDVNERTIGVSLMGHFVSTNPSDAMKDATADLVAWRFSLAGLEAKGTYRAGGLTLNRIAGHRNVVSTACPGERAYQWLSASGGLRDTVEDRSGWAYPIATGLKAESASAASLSLDWDDVEDAPHYRVQLSKSSSMSGATYHWFAESEGRITGLDSGTRYWFRVAVIDPETGSKLGDYTQTPYPSATTTDGYEFSIPTGLRAASTTPRSLSLEWNAVSGAPLYRVQLSKSSSMSGATYHTVDEASAVISGLDSDTKYWFRVAVVDPDTGAKLSDYTQTPYPSASTRASYAGGYDYPVPEGLSPTASTPTSLTLDWDEVDDAEQYRVQLSTRSSMSGATYHWFSEPEGTISGLDSDTRYWFRVAVIDPTTGSKLSDYTQTPYPSASTRAAYPGGYSYPVPEGLSAESVSDTSLSLDWDDVAGAPHYRVQLSKNSSMSGATYHWFGDSEGRITGLDSDTRYWFRVAVIDPTTGSKLSDYTQTPYPSAPTRASYAGGYDYPVPEGLSPTASTPTSLTLDWDEVDDAEQYRVQLSTRSSMSGATYHWFSEPEGRISGLDSDTRYWFRVAVIDPDTGAKLSDYTQTPYPSAVTPEAYQGGYAYPVPEGLSAESVSDSSLSLDWDDVAGAPHYRVQLSKNSSMSGATYHWFGDSEGRITGLDSDTRYWFRVAVIDPTTGSKLSDYTQTPYPSAVTTGTYPGGYSHPIPTGLTASSVSGSSLSLNWNDVDGAPQYRVQLSKNSSMSGASYYRFDDSEGQITGLSAGTRYYFRVAVIDATSGAKLSDYTQKPYPSASTSSSGRNSITVPSSRSIVFKGHGYGHGIGMGQYGAEGQAREGRSWTQILSFYYPGTTRTARSGDIRVLITDDTTDSVMVEAKSGIRFRRGSTSFTLPTTIGGRPVIRWSIDPASSDKRKSNLRYRTTSTWQVYDNMSWTGPAQFEAGTLELVMPSGQANRVYREVLRSVPPTSGATYRNTVNELSLENYVRGVVAREMPSSWRAEALKAQSVAARTYGVRGLTSSRYYDMCDTTSCQVYGGVLAETSATDAAVQATNGTILTYNGSPALTQFSSSSGGYTNAGSQPYLKPVADPYDAWSGNKNHSWSITVKASTIESKYSSIGTLKSLSITERNGYGDMGGRVNDLKLVGSKGTKTISGVDARWAFGLKSDWFGF